ncbi:MAG: VWA domain-containing protein [Spirochaetaceae bacterium]|nr:VWA domain-containing protein [Spirochaetaceae bacterium]
MPSFQHPGMFFLLLMIPVLYLLRYFKVLKKPALPAILTDWKGESFIWNRPLESIAHVVSTVMFIAGFVCVVFALADPVVVRQEKVYTSKGTDLLFVLDTSPSMMAKDIADTNRLQVAKNAIYQMLPEAGGTAFGLVAMGSEAAMVVPPTTDRDLFVSQLNALYAGSLGDGTAIGEGLSTAVYHLSSSSAPKKCIVLVTDGENNAGKIHPETAARLVTEYDISLYALGVGTKGSVPIEYVDPVSGQVYSGYLDSQFDSSVLEKIAEEAGGMYFGIESSSALYAALSNISGREQTVQSFYLKTCEESRYEIFLGISIIAFAVAWLLRRLYIGEQL